MISLRLFLLVMLAAALGRPSVAHAQNFVRLEVHPIATVTLTGEQFLTGDKAGKPTMLAGELRIPKLGTDKLPAVVLVHGSGGISASMDRWASELNQTGVATFILDSFAGRGIVSTVQDQTQLHSLAMMVDAYRALALLARHPRIDPARIAVMGFSKGAVASVYSSNERFRALYGPEGAQFALHIGLYTPCNVMLREDARTTGKPIRLFHGITDDYVAIGPCRSYVERLTKAGADAALTEFPGAHHAYDNPLYGATLHIPQGQTTRNCSLEEAEGGAILNRQTGKPFSLADPCVEKGPHVGFNAAARQGTLAGVRQILQTRFNLKPE